MNALDKIAIVGTTQMPTDLARNAVHHIWQSAVGATAFGVDVATFIRGPVHSEVAKIAREAGCAVSRLHGSKDLPDWAPDQVWIVWDGRSLGCQAIMDLCTKHQILSRVLLCRANGQLDYLGSNSHSLRSAEPPTMPVAELCAAAEQCRGANQDALRFDSEI